MTSKKEGSVLRRMTTEVQVPLDQPSVVGMLRLALEQASDKALGLALEATDCEADVLGRNALGPQLPQNALFAVLEGQVPGFLVMESSVVGGIVEHQTIGRILGNDHGDRRPTRVDAALVAPFVDAALERMTQAAEAADTAPWGRGLAFGAMVPDCRTLLLALVERDYHVFSLELQLGEGQRQGRLILGFADLPQEVVNEEETVEERDTGRATVRAGVLSAPATLDAVIARLTVPLKDLQTLKVGETLAIPADALRRTWLEAKGTDHAIRVNLGQLNGFRAVRLVSTERRSPETLVGGGDVEAAARDLALVAAAEPAPQIVQDIASVPASGAGVGAGSESGLDDLDALLEAAEEVDVLTPV